MPKDPDRTPSTMSGLGEAMGASAELVATTGVGLGLGWLADKGLHTSPAFLFVGALLGGAAGIWRVYRLMMRKM